MKQITIKLEQEEKLPIIVYINGIKYIKENELSDLRFGIEKVNNELERLHEVIDIVEGKQNADVNNK